MKVIFLDIDGVLNVEVFINAVHYAAGKTKIDFMKCVHDDYGNLFCPTAVNQLEGIIEETGAKIVISSSWRYSGLKVMQEMWKARNLPGEVIDIIPTLEADNDLSFKERAERGHEIALWVNQNEPETYVIIDDDDDMLPFQEKYFVKTQPMYGLTRDLAEKCINILNAE